MFEPALRALCIIGMGIWICNIDIVNNWVNKTFPNLGPYLSFFNSKSVLLYRIGNDGKPGLLPGMFVSPHSIAYDSFGNIYVGDVVETDWDKAAGLMADDIIKKCSGSDN